MSPTNNTTAGNKKRHNNDNGPTEVVDADAVIAAPSVANSAMEMQAAPAEIPPEPKDSTIGDDDEERDVHDDADGGGDEEEQQEDDDESEYSYEDDDDAAFSGFLDDHQSALESSTADHGNSEAAPARIRDEEESDSAAAVAKASSSTTSAATAAEPRKPKWREPSRAAVSMSLRAERETTGSKRRLAQDLYRIMNQDTEEAGFSIAPKSEDNMDNWTIKLFKFDEDSNLAKDLAVLNFDHVELEMSFPEQYPFEPPFVRVVRPRFKRQTGFVMNGALCMELLTNDGWNPVNDIESVIVSVRSLLVVGDGRLQAAAEMSEAKYAATLKAARKTDEAGAAAASSKPAADAEPDADSSRKRARKEGDSKPAGSQRRNGKDEAGSYSVAEAHAAYSHLSDYHKKKGWDSSGWWARKG